MRRLLAVGIAAAVWLISWYLATGTGFVAWFGTLYWDTEPLTVVAFAVATVVLAFGGPLVGVWVGWRIWRSVPGTPVEELPPGWGQKPRED